MTRFDPNKQHKSAIDWSAIAFQTADDDKAAETVVVGAVVGAAIASVTTPVLGGVIACYFVIKGVQKSISADKNRKVIRETGCVAHILTDGNFRAYKHQVGEDAVIRELQFAQENGLAFSNDALDFYEDYLDSLPSMPKAMPFVQELNSDTTSIELMTKNARTTAVVDRYDPMATAKVDIIGEMSDRVTNTIIIGIPGSGKGILISNAIRAVKKKYPNLKVFVIDPKDDPKEAGYFDCCDEIKSYACMDAKPATVAAWAENAFDEYAKYASNMERTLLIVDEGTMLGNKLAQAKSTLLVDKLTAYTSGGDSAGRNVWFMMQSPYVGSASLNLSTSSQMTTIVIAFKENIGALVQWKSAKIFKNLSLDEVSELIDISETGRAVYYGKTSKWYTMPTLTNYSGYNRDTRTYLLGYEPKEGTPKQSEDSPNTDNNQLGDRLDLPNPKLSETAQLILDWLKEKRPKQWVKFKGKDDRDMSFVNFLSDKSLKAEQRDEVFQELAIAELIEVSPDGDYLRLIQF